MKKGIIRLVFILIIIIGISLTIKLIGKEKVNIFITSTKFSQPLSLSAQTKLNSGGKLRVIVGVFLTGNSKIYFDMISENPDNVARQRIIDSVKINRMEAEAVAGAELIKENVLGKLSSNNYSDYTDFRIIPQFVISVNKEGLYELIGDPSVKTISEDVVSRPF